MGSTDSVEIAIRALIQTRPKLFVEAMALPQSLVNRITRDRVYGGGFSGFDSFGRGRVLLAICCCDEGPVFGGNECKHHPGDPWRYYRVCVGSSAEDFNTFTEESLTTMLVDAYTILGTVVREGEVDRMETAAAVVASRRERADAHRP